MAKPIAFPTTRLEFQQWVPDEKACLDYLRQSRWSDGLVCSKCGSARDPYSTLLATRAGGFIRVP